MFRDHRRMLGVTLLELLVVVAILGLLSSLLLVGVVHTLRSARLATCASRLRQIGVAMHAYEASHNRIVLAGARVDGRHISPHVRLLAFLEAEAIEGLINYQRCDYKSHLAGVNVNKTAASRRIDKFLCPADSSAATGTNFFYCAGRGPLWRNWNDETVLVLNDDQGLFMSVRCRQRSQILKGSGQVAAFSERIQGDGSELHLHPRRDITTDSSIIKPQFERGRPFGDRCAAQTHSGERPLEHSSEAGRTWFLPEVGLTAYTHSMTPNAVATDCGDVESFVPTGAVSARSWHSGGVNVLFADGSVRFVSDSIGFDVWQSHASMALD